MYRILGLVAISAFLLGASSISSSATTCGTGCVGNTGVVDPNGFTFGDNAPTLASIKDDFLFSLSSGSKWSISGDTITVPGGVIGSLELSLWSTSTGELGQTTAADVSIVGGDQIATLSFPDIPAILLGGNYYLEVTGIGGANLSYSGNLTAKFEGETRDTTTPLPAALPLFASGLGMLGFWGRRRKRRV